MIKKNKWKLLVSSLVILLPIVFGLLYWNHLPQEMSTHWGLDGNADGWTNKAFAVFLLPVILLAVHLLCVFLSAKIPGSKDQNPKLLGIVLWTIPITSLFTNGIVYAVAFGIDIQPTFLVNLLLGILFIAIGNYLPKCKRSPAIGIKIKWALQNEENWYATHRFGGKVYVAGGFFLLACMFLPTPAALWVSGAALMALIALPVIYSYWYHKKQVKAGTAVITPIPGSMPMKKAVIISLVIVAVLLISLIPLMFTGDIAVEWGENSFTIEASFYPDLTVDYDAVTSIEYRENGVAGTRTHGFGSARLLAGIFHNEEFGSYTRYTYTGNKPCVVLNVGDKVLVIGGSDAAATRAIYQTINAKIG